ncbi:methylated-DNA--[protein]-cysteine S-methyltransferase [Paracoccus methylovorus]|uniref:Methylated-DNA--[protein]-cysteine S-methyltransferase n=1 Tax=Paracoccus methylovorus TaxID=2812658 RepID=A0ABX7JMI6_9RHOB|nr:MULTISPECIES: methylated-DNA--[protein]-cysteine S-methyltransferase [Paracoccus]QRZ15330.1 methylated-DNA--[protein]-cysteine S-methyltransferase [Paracoccus methylovorus]
MTPTLFDFAPPEPRLRVLIATQPSDDLGAILCRGRFPTPFGTVIALGAGGALWGLGFAGSMSNEEVEADLTARWPRARVVEAPEALAPTIHALLAGQGEIAVRLTGTEFQLQVWRALTEVLPGQVISYAMLAARIGRPNALRAVGTAVGQNPVSWAIPCHRVTRSDGSIGGYHWGAAIKAALLTREGASIAPRAIPAL